MGCIQIQSTMYCLNYVLVLNCVCPESVQLSGLMQSIGSEFDQRAPYEAKSDYHAMMNTKLYLDSNLDGAAQSMLQIWAQSNSRSSFYREFFQRHAIVFARDHGLWIDWNCRNCNACAIALMRELGS